MEWDTDPGTREIQWIKTYADTSPNEIQSITTTAGDVDEIQRIVVSANETMEVQVSPSQDRVNLSGEALSRALTRKNREGREHEYSPCNSTNWSPHFMPRREHFYSITCAPFVTDARPLRADSATDVNDTQVHQKHEEMFRSFLPMSPWMQLSKLRADALHMPILNNQVCHEYPTEGGGSFSPRSSCSYDDPRSLEGMVSLRSSPVLRCM